MAHMELNILKTVLVANSAKPYLTEVKNFKLLYNYYFGSGN